MIDAGLVRIYAFADSHEVVFAVAIVMVCSAIPVGNRPLRAWVATREGEPVCSAQPSAPIRLMWLRGGTLPTCLLGARPPWFDVSACLLDGLSLGFRLPLLVGFSGPRRGCRGGSWSVRPLVFRDINHWIVCGVLRFWERPTLGLLLG